MKLPLMAKLPAGAVCGELSELHRHFGRFKTVFGHQRRPTVPAAVAFQNPPARFDAPPITFCFDLAQHTADDDPLLANRHRPRFDFSRFPRCGHGVVKVRPRFVYQRLSELFECYRRCSAVGVIRLLA
jgi:hypothetical protein